jgi:hypothetical protein
MDYIIIISLLTLLGLEVILGIDNVIFISILANKLPEHQQKKEAPIPPAIKEVARAQQKVVLPAMRQPVIDRQDKGEKNEIL